MQKLAEICIRRPVFACCLILVLVVFGVFGYTRLGVDRFPKVDFPTVTVTTVLPGAAPEEIETEITDKIEEAVNTVSGIDELRSASVEGISQVYVTFVLEKNIDVAAQEVRDRVNAVLPELPDDIDQPTVEKFDSDAAPILGIMLAAPLPMKEITEYADKVLRRQLESVSGVGQVRLVGGQKRQINIVLDPLKLRAHGLTVADVARALRTQNLQVPGGTVRRGGREYTVRTLGRVGKVAEIERIPVALRNEHTVVVKDLGEVEDGVEEPTSAARLNDTPGVLLNVRKQSGANTVEVAAAVKERLAQIMQRTPPGFRIEVVRDHSRFIEAATDAVKEHLVLGAIFAALVVMLFLNNWRTTVIAAIAIPTSIVGTFAVLWYMGYTLNMISLLALTLSVGIVIDDGVVVLENIYRYIEELGYKPFDAAIAATREIGPAVMAITLSLVAVFLPIAFMSGIVGRFMQSFGVTMSTSIIISLLVSFTLTPMLSARWLKVKRPQAASNGNGGEVIDEEHSFQDYEKAHGRAGSKKRGFYHVVEVAYLALLRFCLRWRWLVVLVCVVALGSVPVLFGKVRKNFLPDDDQSEFLVSVRTPEGTSLEATQAIIDRIGADIRRLNGVRYTIASVADTEQRVANLGNIYVRLLESGERSFGQLELMDFVRREVLARHTAEKLRVSVTQVPAFSGGGYAASDIQFMVSGPDISMLERYAGLLKERLVKMPGATDVDSSLVIGKPELGVTVDREKAANLGVSVSDIAGTLRLLVAGDKVSDYDERGERYDVHVRAMPDSRNDVGILNLVTVPSVKLGSVALSDVVRIREGIGPSQIDRLNRRRQVTLTANLVPGSSEQALIDNLNAAVGQIGMDPDYTTGLVGRSKEMGRAARSFAIVFLTSFIFMYLVIAAQFESWLNPLIILLALPLTFPFALLAQLLFGESLNVFSTLGVLVLFAVVKKNSILQVDHTNQLRAQGMPRDEAILAANLDRLRPILMTTFAFVAGMVPLMVSESAGAATNKTISSVVIGGQTLSLLLTLVATPVAYSLLDDLVHARIWGWLGRLPAAVAGLGRRAGRRDAG